MMSRLACALQAVLLLVSLSACAPPPSSVSSAACPTASATQTGAPDTQAPATLTVATLSSTRVLDFTIAAFRQAHPGIDIQVRDFGTQVSGMKQSADVDMTPLIQALYTEIMSGAGPDIIMIEDNDLPFYKLAARGMLSDVGALMDADISFDRSLYYTNIFDACKTGDKLYAVPASVTFFVLACNKQNSPGTGNVTMDQFLAKAQSLPRGVFAFAKFDPAGLAVDCLKDSFSVFIDYGAKTARFDSPEFIGTIQAFKTLMDSKMSPQGPEDDGELEQMMKGTVAYQALWVGRKSELFMAKAALGQDAVFTNMPSMASESGYTFVASTMLSINAQSKHQQTAWEFIKTMLSEDAPANGNLDGFLVMKSAAQKQLEAMTGGDVLTDKNGDRVVVTLGSSQVEVKPLAEADVAFLRDRLGSLNRLLIVDHSIEQIIMEELPSFFAGQKPAEDVANLIQNRVITVLNE